MSPIYLDQINSGCLYYRLAGSITEHDLRRLRVQEDSVFNTFRDGEGVGVVADLTDLHTISPQLLSDLRQMRMVRDDHVRVVVVVGANPYLRALAISLGIAVGKHQFVFSETVDEALALVGAYSVSYTH